MIKTYYYLTKPGIIYGNLLTTTGSFLFAADGLFYPALMLATLSGTGLIIASACVCNNYLDRGIDAKMARTKQRALVTGIIPVRLALTYAAGLGLAGFAMLLLQTNRLTAALGLIAFWVYVVAYGLAKRHSVHGTLVGSIAGALPPVAGYTAVTAQLDSTAWLLFAIMVAWQMPHFYAIAIYRLKDYRAAGLPVLPAIRGIAATKRQMTGYIIAFIIACALLTIVGPAGYSFLIIMTGLGLVWLNHALQGFKTKDDGRWARHLFRFSLIVILVFSAMLALDPGF